LFNFTFSTQVIGHLCKKRGAMHAEAVLAHGTKLCTGVLARETHLNQSLQFSLSIIFRSFIFSPSPIWHARGARLHLYGVLFSAIFHNHQCTLCCPSRSLKVTAIGAIR